MVKLTIKKTNPDWLEATWSDGEQVIWCESFSGHKEHIEMLKAKCIEYGTELTDEDLQIINEISEAYVYPTDEEIEAEKETQRILLIKSKARELIEKEYPMYKQNNILMSGINVDIKAMNDYISNIRKISNEAEINKTLFDDIVWK